MIKIKQERKLIKGFRTLNINNADKKIYYVSQWETTFATSSQETQYLLHFYYIIFFYRNQKSLTNVRLM